MRDPAQCIPSVLKLMQFSSRGRGRKHADYAASMRELIQISFDTFAIRERCWRLALKPRKRWSITGS